MAKFPYLRTVEDVVVAAAAGITTYQAGGSADDILGAVIAAPGARSLIALGISYGQSSGLIEAVSIFRKIAKLATSVASDVKTDTPPAA